MKLKYFALCAILFLGSCKAQKSSVEYKEVIKTDTFIREQIKTIYQPTNDSIIINNPCDSLGILQAFSIIKTIPNGKAKIKSSGNNLVVSISTDKVLQTSESQKEKSTNSATQIKEVEVIKYRIPEWAIYALVIETILIAGFIYLKTSKV